MKLLTELDMEARLKELGQVRVELDIDPVSNGITSLNGKLAQIQLFKDRVAFLITEALQNSNTAEVLHETIKGEYERQIEVLLATDSSVMAQKSTEMRNATAKQKMPELVLRVHYAEIDQLKASGYLKVLQSVASNLESTNSNLSRQITVIQLAASMNEIQRSATGTTAGTLTKTY